jgi:hypothetical protein
MSVLDEMEEYLQKIKSSLEDASRNGLDDSYKELFRTSRRNLESYRQDTTFASLYSEIDSAINVINDKLGTVRQNISGKNKTVKHEPIDKRLLQDPPQYKSISHSEQMAKDYLFYEEKIKELYKRRDEDPKYFDMAIKACYEEIKMAKNAIPELTKKTYSSVVKDTETFYEELRTYVKGETDIEPSPFIPGVFEEDPPNKLGYHTGFKQLCIIREKEGNYAEVIQLAEQAKNEGWFGDWDKRIEKAKKKLGATQ